jgi:hypothetical protein
VINTVTVVGVLWRFHCAASASTIADSPIPKIASPVNVSKTIIVAIVILILELFHVSGFF